MYASFTSCTYSYYTLVAKENAKTVSWGQREFLRRRWRKNGTRFLEAGPARSQILDDREEGEKEGRQEAEGFSRLMREQPVGIRSFCKKRLTNSA